MPKQATQEIQDYLVQLGNELGFRAQSEWTWDTGESAYAPRLDVVWFYESGFDTTSLTRFFASNESLLRDIENVPFAAFEVEGSTTSSKNQLGNLANICGSPFIHKFLVTNNEAAGNENDTFRRAHKLVRHAEKRFGDKGVILIDCEHLFAVRDRSIAYETSGPVEHPPASLTRTGAGGEKDHPAFNELFTALQTMKMLVKQDAAPDWYAWEYERVRALTKDSTNDDLLFYYNTRFYNIPNGEVKEGGKPVTTCYTPKIDILAGTFYPKAFITWARAIAESVGKDAVRNAFLFHVKHAHAENAFLPLIAIEVETGKNKHMHGGIVNASENAPVGLVVTDGEADHHATFFKRYFGYQNVAYYAV